MGTSGKKESQRQATQLTLEIWHPNCWTLETTATVDAGMVAHSVHEYDGLINARVTAYADRHDDIAELVSAIDDSELTSRVEWVTNYLNPLLRTYAAGNVAEELLIRFESANSIHDAILSRGFIANEEIRIIDGYEYWTVIVTAARSTIQPR